jgi:hypothetical protein
VSLALTEIRDGLNAIPTLEAALVVLQAIEVTSRG